jgi:hypothetical protein
MSTKVAKKPIASPTPVGEPLDIKQLTVALIKHYNLHDGLYDLYLEYRMAFGAFGPKSEDALPSAILGLSKLSLSKVDKSGPLTVDAGEVNPVKKRAVSKSTKSKSKA